MPEQRGEVGLAVCGHEIGMLRAQVLRDGVRLGVPDVLRDNDTMVRSAVRSAESSCSRTAMAP